MKRRKEDGMRRERRKRDKKWRRERSRKKGC